MGSSVKASCDNLVDVVITTDHIAVLDPPVAILQRELEYQAKTFIPGGMLGYEEVEETVTLSDFDFKGRLFFAAGLLPRVRKVLREHGYRVRVDDRRVDNTRLCVDQDVLENCDPRERSLLEAVARQRLGQIEAAAEKDVFEKCVLVASLFPKARIVVAAATRKQAWKWQRDLEERLEESVGLALAKVRRKGRRWLVAALGSVPRKSAGKKDILLLPYAEEATGGRAADMVAEMGFRRIYAFIRPQRRPDRHVQLRLEQMAGAVIHRIARPRVGVQVLMLPTPVCTVTTAARGLEGKRLLYWHNTARNENVAAVASAVIAGDRAALKAVGLRNRDIRLLDDTARRRTVVLVETPEHARELLSLLPDWHTLDMRPEVEADKEEKTKRNLNMPAIITMMYAAKMGITADILIRATGTEWPLRVKGFPPRRDDTNIGQMLMLDFADDFAQRARKDAQHRMQEYQRAGMNVRMTAGAAKV